MKLNIQKPVVMFVMFVVLFWVKPYRQRLCNNNFMVKIGKVKRKKKPNFELKKCIHNYFNSSIIIHLNKTF